MVERFSEKHVIVTGGANGIGKATVLRLLDEGAQVAVFDKAHKDSDAATLLFDEVGDKAARLTYHAVDLTQEPLVNEVVASVAKEFGSIEALVCVAGLSQGYKRLEDVSLEEWDRYHALNVTNPFLTIRAVLPAMKTRKYGRIVTVSSTSGRTASPWTGYSYASAKAGLIGFTRRLAMAMGKYGITANVMAPGFAETQFVMDGLKQAPEGFIEQRVSEIPLGRGAHPSEMASAIAFLASDDASYVTGAVLDVNGGSFIG